MAACCLNRAEEKALMDACEHWAHLSFDPYDTSDINTAYNRIARDVPPDYSPPTGEWEELQGQDQYDVNMAEVWSDGNRFLQEEALHEYLANNPPEDLPPSLSEGKDTVTMGGFLFKPFEVEALVLKMGENYIHARSNFGDVYINPKLTKLVSTSGGEGATVKLKVVKAADVVRFTNGQETVEAFPRPGDVTEKMYDVPDGFDISVSTPAFPLKAIEVIIPEEKKHVIADVEVIKTSNHRGSRIHGGSRIDTGEKVWIDKFYTNIIFSKHGTVFKMKLVRNDRNGYPYKAVFVWP